MHAWRNLPPYADIIALIAESKYLNYLSPKPLIRLVIRFYSQVRLDKGFKTKSHVDIF
jgi:hypothetical protein